MTVRNRASASARTILKISASSAALGAAMLLGGAAFAQDVQAGAPVADQAAAAQTADTAPADSDIVVTGFRRSLENAVAEKKSRDQVVESISAEDIGKLPDASIAESIARLPGVTSQRVNGRSNSISIRGFAPDFSTTLLNGREQTSTGDNRAVEYDQYPAEVVNQVLIYKTANAGLIGQGLSGTVDLRTIRPLDYGKRVFSVGARGTYADIGKLNAGSKDKGYRATATYVDQFANDTIGVSLSASYLDEPYQIQEFNAWGYAGAGTAASPAAIGGSKSYVTSTNLKRLGLQGTLQYRPIPEVTATFDGFYSDFNDDQIKRGIELPLGFGAATTVLTPTTVTNGLVTAGRYSGVEGVVRNDSFERKAKLYSFGYNGKYEGDDGWNAQVDVSLSRTERDETILETYSGTGYGQGNGAQDTIGFVSSGTGTFFQPTLNYSDPSLVRLTDPLGWGGANVQAGYYNDRHIVDDLKQYRVEIEREMDSPISSVKFGLNYTDRNKSLTPNEALVQLANGALEQALPSQYQLTPTNLSYLGLGPILSYDPNTLLDAGVYRLSSNNANLDVAAKAYTVQERIMTSYLQANIKQQLGASELTGNFGVQGIFTNQKSPGFVAANGSLLPVTRGANYVDFLPSVNLSLRLPSDIVIRAAAARQMQRPRLDDMRIALSYGYDAAQGILTGSGGNPELRPIRSNSYDVTIEKYFGNRGYLAVQGFYKDLKSFVSNITDTNFSYVGYPLPANAPAGTPLIGTATIPVNAQGGSIYGVEVAGTLPLGEIVGALDGFGLTGGGSYTKTEVVPTPGGKAEDIPGYSRWVANGTAYFEKWGFSARGSLRYRSTFVGELSGFGASLIRRRAAGEMIIDGQVGYDFTKGFMKGLSVYVQGQNLTNEPFVTINGTRSDEIIDYQSYGRRFLAGASFKF